MSVEWQPVWPVKGDAKHTRVMASSLNGGLYACREKLAAKARPSLFAERPFDRMMQGRSAPYRTFALGVVFEAVQHLVAHPELVAPDSDPLEAAALLVDAVLTEGSPAHAGARNWAVHALLSYFEVDDYLRDEVPGLTPVGARAVLFRSQQGEVKEIDVWGLWLRSTEENLIELRLLRQRSVHDVTARDAAFVATVAKIAADGRPYEYGGKRYYPYVGLNDELGAPVRVRVVDVGLADASAQVLFDGSADEARALYREVAAPAVAGVLAGGAFNPGTQCGNCSAVEVCPVMPTRPGLLGVVGLATHRRYLTHTRLRTYAVCPAQSWLADESGVPRARRETTSAARRGLLVHAALEWLHSRDSATACVAADFEAESGVPPVAQAIGAIAEEWGEVARYLRQHIAVCPLYADVEWVRPEPSLVAFDNEADVIVSARPDLLVGSGSAITWRETKTMAAAPGDDDLALLDQFPQIAFGLVMVAAGLADPEVVVAANESGATTDVRPGWVELEILTPNDSRVARYSTTDAQTLLRARVVLASLVDPWLLDTAFAPHQGSHCAWCPVQEWCRPDLATDAARAAVAIELDGYRIDPDTGEILPLATPSGDAAGADVVAVAAPAPSVRVRSLADSIIGVLDAGTDDDLPF